MTSPIALADAFPVFTEDDWRAAAAKARLGNARPVPDSAMDGIDGIPLRQRRPGARAIVTRAEGVPWQVIQRIDASDAQTAIRDIADDIAGGATGIEVIFTGGAHPLAGKLPSAAGGAVARGLAAVPALFQVRVGSGDPAVLAAFVDLAAEGRIGLVRAFDPVAALAVRGSALDTTADVSAAAKAFDARGAPGTVVIADGRPWHAGGATEEQELGVTLATFVAHLRVLAAPERIGVTLAADSDQFRGIAKFRAIRLLLARVAEIAGIDAPPPRVHAETAWRTMSRRAPQMNVLRATCGAFAASVGGANSITVLPFDALDPMPGRHAARLARNTQTILAEEAHLFRVADPGAGSGTIEALTSSLAEAAWKRFQAIEAEGGIVAAIEDGSLLREIAEARDARVAAVASGDQRIIGVNAPATERPATKFKRMPVGRAARLVFKRLAEPFETTTP